MQNAFRHWHCFVSHAAALLRDESGQALIPAVMLMVGVLGFVGLAVDVGQMRLTARQLQTAADAAAVAGAIQISACGGVPGCSVMRASVTSALVENGISNSTLGVNCSSSTGSGIVVSLNNAPCALGSSTNDPNYGDVTYVETVLSKAQPTYFAALFGITTMKLSARAEAGVKSPSACMYALDAVGSGALTVLPSANIESPNCGIVVESSRSAAISCASSSSISASQISVVGSHLSFPCLIHPGPVAINMPGTPDPLAYLPKPAVGGCGSSTASPYMGAKYPVVAARGGNIIFYPGTYCGGISIPTTATVTFMPGTYILTSWNGSNGLSVSCGATVNGSGTMFYNYGPSGSIRMLASSGASSGGGGVHLTAPVGGPYSGILFFQDPGNTAAATLIGTSNWNTVLEGAFYFPSAMVNYAFDGVVNYSVLVARDITFPGTAGIVAGANNKNDFSSLSNGSPLQKTIPVLVQ